MRRATVLERSCDDVTAWSDILEKAQGTVFRLVGKSFRILLISRASSLCNLCVLCVSVVTKSEQINHKDTENTEVAQRRQPKFLTRETLVTLTKGKMKLDAYRKQRRIQFHARFYVRTIAEHTLRVDGQPDFLEIEEECVL